MLQGLGSRTSGVTPNHATIISFFVSGDTFIHIMWKPKHPVTKRTQILQRDTIQVDPLFQILFVTSPISPVLVGIEGSKEMEMLRN
jgi:hypothetical protein